MSTTDSTDLDAARKNLQQWVAKVLPQEPREFVDALERFTRAVVDAPLESVGWCLPGSNIWKSGTMAEYDRYKAREDGYHILAEYKAGRLSAEDTLDKLGFGIPIDPKGPRASEGLGEMSTMIAAGIDFVQKEFKWSDRLIADMSEDDMSALLSMCLVKRKISPEEEK